MSDVALRRAALTLHSLHPSDRGWMLAQLAPTARQQMRALLDELTQLGIPADPTLLAPALQATPAKESPAAQPAAAPGLPADQIQRIETVEPRRLFVVLSKESPALVAELMAMYPWAWRPAVLALFPQAQQRALIESIQRLQGQAGQPSAMRAASLLRGLSAALHHQANGAGTVPSVASGGKHRLVGLVTQWWRQIHA